MDDTWGLKVPLNVFYTQGAVGLAKSQFGKNALYVIIPTKKSEVIHFLLLSLSGQFFYLLVSLQHQV